MRTVGGRFRDARRRRELSVEQAEEATKVRAKYLKAIEADHWSDFPSMVYTLGFVRRYSDFLGLPTKEITEEFKSEFSHVEKIKLHYNKSKNKFFKKIVITPKVIISVVVSLVVVGLISYLVVSIVRFSNPPAIEITSPGSQTSQDKMISIEGTTLDTAEVAINDQNVNVDGSGHFSQQVELTAGVNFFEIKAKNRLGRESSKLIKVLYEPKTN